jgi:hypothetical protein
VDGNYFPTHLCVLVSRSTYFAVMLRHTGGVGRGDTRGTGGDDQKKGAKLQCIPLEEVPHTEPHTLRMYTSYVCLTRSTCTLGSQTF